MGRVYCRVVQHVAGADIVGEHDHDGSQIEGDRALDEEEELEQHASKDRVVNHCDVGPEVAGR